MSPLTPTADKPSPTAAKLSSTLGDLSAQLPLKSTTEEWQTVELSAQALANELRVKDGTVDNHTALGKTLLPTTLSILLKLAIPDLAQADDQRVAAAYELLRVGANLCVDHDGNREQLLESGYVQSVVSLLERYVEALPEPTKDSAPMPLSIAHLKVVKTAVGVLLNTTINFEPVRVRLCSLETAQTLLRLSNAIYPCGSWLTHTGPLSPADPDTPEAVYESWLTRAGLSNWAWRTISELKGEDEEEAEPPSRAGGRDTSLRAALFGPDALPLLVYNLRAFVPPYPSAPAEGSSATADAIRPARAQLLSADFAALEETCSVLEGLCLDVEDARLALARGLAFPEGEHGGVRCLEDILTFVEHGDHPPLWAEELSAEERQRREKAFAFCKAAAIKVVVEVAGDDKNTDVLWDESEPGTPGGPFVWKMVQWLRKHKDLKATGRDDLVICATLSLGNICRREAHSITMVKPPTNIASDLVPLITPETDIKVMHGVLGLLKHLSQTASNRAPLGQAGVIGRLASCQIWADKADMAEVVQVSAIGIAKHLCNGNVDNVFELVLTASGADSSGSALAQILALGRRSDSVAVKSEGTRVLVTAIRTLWSSEASGGEKRKEAMVALCTYDCSSALAQLVARSRKYPILINEGIVALTLLSTHSKGGPVVIDALMEALPRETNPRAPGPPAGSTSSEGSPVVGASPRALDTVLSVLRNRDGRLQPEVRANGCALLGQLGRPGVVGSERAAELARLKEVAKPVLEALAAGASTGGAPQAGEAAKGNVIVASAAKRALEAWGA